MIRQFLARAVASGSHGSWKKKMYHDLRICRACRRPAVKRRG
jgi:hypothetical protein